MAVNIIEATDPKDRPTEAVAQLRSIERWLRAEGYLAAADDAADLANIIHIYYDETDEEP